MIPGFEKIVEERIEKARRNGAFNNLAGSGKPIIHEDDTGVPEDLRLAYKMLKNAGFVPPELETSCEIKRTEDLLKQQDDTVERYRLMKKLSLLMRKRNIEDTPFGSSTVLERYNHEIIERLGTKTKK